MRLAAAYLLSATLVLSGTGIAVDPVTEPLRLLPPPLGSLLPNIPHDPIAIDGDDELCESPLSGVTNCLSATGSCDPYDPFLIDGWRIRVAATDARPAIRLANTTACVEIAENALLTEDGAPSPAIELANVRNVRVEENVVAVGGDGALLGTQLTDVAIVGNTLMSMRGAGAADVTLADVEAATRLRVANNSFDGAAGNGAEPVGTLLAVRDAPAAAIARNAYSKSAGPALDVTRSPGVAIANETIVRVLTGIALVASPNATLSGIAVAQAANGIDAFQSNDLSIVDTYLEDHHPCEPSCAPVGMRFTDSTSTVKATTIRGFDVGASIDKPASQRAEFECLTFDGNGIGILIRDFGGDEAGGGVDVTYVHRSNFVNNTIAGVVNVGESTYHAERNWWNHPEGPTLAGGPPRGDAVLGRVKVTPFAVEHVSC